MVPSELDGSESTVALIDFDFRDFFRRVEKGEKVNGGDGSGSGDGLFSLFALEQPLLFVWKKTHVSGMNFKALVALFNAKLTRVSVRCFEV